MSMNSDDGADAIQEDIEEPSESQTEKRSLRLISIATLLIFILLFGFVGWQLRHKSETPYDAAVEKILREGETKDGYLYNGYAFVNTSGLWNTRWQKEGTEYSINFHYSPREVEWVPVAGSLDPLVNLSHYYLTFNPTANNLSQVALASSEIGLSLTRGFNVIITVACDRNETEACATRPIITCNTTDSAVIYLNNVGTPAVVLDANCIELRGEQEGILKSAEKMLYNFYGIIPVS